MADLQKIAEDLSSLSVIEAAELSKILEEKWGVSAAAAAPVAVSGAGGGDAAPAAEAKTEFDVHLTAVVAIHDVHIILIVRQPAAPAADASAGRHGATPLLSAVPALLLVPR